MTSNIQAIQDEIIDEFRQLPDWFAKYEYLIKLGKSLKTLDESLKTEENLLPSCQSTVWITAQSQDNRIHYGADSDSLLVKGMLYLILKVFNDQTPETIKNTDLYFIESTGLDSHLSPSRVNGLFSIIDHMKSSADEYR
jgi:cysteine desulfuration protein SufE